jgi:translation initiation factor 2B subunit (eIF-2B alpha/beta/delta family)
MNEKLRNLREFMRPRLRGANVDEFSGEQVARAVMAYIEKQEEKVVNAEAKAKVATKEKESAEKARKEAEAKGAKEGAEGRT